MSIRLNVGCGDPFCHAPAPWVNIDVRPNSQPDVMADARDLPYEDGSVELIYAGHVLEHLDLEDVQPTLEHFYRLLELGGVLLMVGPDADKTPRLLAAGTITAERAAQNGDHPDLHDDPGAHHWFSSARAVLPMCWEAGFDARELDIAATPTDFPVYDRVTPDQYAVIAWKH